MAGEDTKPCKFCGESIVATARKCRFCGEFQEAADRARVAAQKIPGAETFAPCYQCGNTAATRVTWTWWGGVLGPRLFTHVKCGQCGTTYNGKSGASNMLAIVCYQGLALLLVIGVIVLAAFGAHH